MKIVCLYIAVAVSIVGLAIASNFMYAKAFPMKYQTEITFASQKYDLEEEVLYSIINTESHFDKNAVSSKGAVGLMQIMPSTANEIAEKLKFAEYDLKDPQTNIEFGAFYFKQLLQKFEDVGAAVCAYNAGPANVKEWLEDKEKSDDGKNLKEVPFKETRQYVERFWKNMKYYKSKLM